MSASRSGAGILTFLIADVRGYTAFTQSRGDEAAAILAAKFAEIAREGVEAHDGEVIELRGDEALAVFGSAREALRAAVALQLVLAGTRRRGAREPGRDASLACARGDRPARVRRRRAERAVRARPRLQGRTG